jgi:small subunit ribosomal protein S7
MCTIKVFRKYKPFLYSTAVSKVVNHLTKNGKKSIAYLILLKVLFLLKIKMPFLNPFYILSVALKNIMPLIQLRLWIKSGKSYRIPFFISENRRILLAVKWLILSAQDRAEKTMFERVSAEILDGFFYRGSSIKKKLDLYEIASANRPFITFLPWDRSFNKNKNLKRNVKKIN